MIDQKDNVKVGIRVRPPNERESSEHSKHSFSISETSNSVSLELKFELKTFTFDYVAGESTSQEELFERIGKPVADSCLAGYNSTIFAYGQTGAGKTFTILGPSGEIFSENFSSKSSRGLLPRCFEYIFNTIESSCLSREIEFSVKCSYLEIYQEQINDLLDPSPQSLLLREDLKRGVYVEGLLEEEVRNIEETYNLLRIGTQNRHVGSTSMNKESSRSHSVFTLLVESKESKFGLFKTSRFHLIDLAGSERQKATDSAGERLKEAGMINKSLSALGNVINSLVDISEGKSRHIHYRDSKLTFLLKDSLGGNSKTFIIANISPAFSALNETVSTLKFAQRAKQIKNSAHINEETSGVVQVLQVEIRKLKEELLAKENLSSDSKNLERFKDFQDFVETSGIKCSKCCTCEDKKDDLYRILFNCLKDRKENSEFYEKELKNKDCLIENFKNAQVKLESKVNHDKMVLKFRDSTISRLQSNAPDTEKQIIELKQEINFLRDQLENNPFIARLFVENEKLKASLQDQKNIDVYQERIRELEENSCRLAENLQETVESSQKTINKLLKERQEVTIRPLEEETRPLPKEVTFRIVNQEELSLFKQADKENWGSHERICQAKANQDLLGKISEVELQKEQTEIKLLQRINQLILEQKEREEEFSEIIKNRESKNQSQVHQFNILIKDLNEKIENLEKNNQIVRNLTENEKNELESVYQHKITLLQDQIVLLQTSSYQLNQELETLSLKYDSTLKAKTQIELFNFDLQEKVESLEQELTCMKLSHEPNPDLQVYSKQLETRLEETEADLLASKREVQNISCRLQDLLADNQELKLKIQLNTKRVVNFKEELVSTVLILSSQEKNLQISELSQNLSKLQSLLAEKNDLIDFYSVELEKSGVLEQEHYKLSDKIKVITEKNDSLSLTLQSTKHALDESCKKVDFLKSELNSLKFQSESFIPFQLEHELLKSKLEDQDKTMENLKKAKNDLEEQVLTSLSNQKTLENCLESVKSELIKCKQDRDLKLSETNNQISLLEIELQKTTEQKSSTEELLLKTQTLQQDLKFAKSALDSFQELNLSLTQKNAELSNSLGKMHSSHVPLYIADQLRRELVDKGQETEELREENRKKTEILKNTKISINNTKAEIANWKKCIDEKNSIIQELRNEARKGEDDNPEVKFLRKALQNKERELKELKDKGHEYYAQADHTIESMRRKCLVYQNEANCLREEIKGIHQPERFRSAVFRENDEVCIKKEDFLNLKNLNNKLSEELRVSRETSESLQKQNIELIKRLNEEGFRKKTDNDAGKELIPKVSGFIRHSSVFLGQ